MNRAMINSLTEAERLFIAETERAALHQLSEDELIALHARARQMRNKYVGLYRRQASSKVGVKGGRGAARPASNRNRDRAEVFEDALSRVSTRLAAVARAAAAELRAERIQAAREAKGAAPAAASKRVATAPTKSARGATKSASGGAVKPAPNPRRGERSLKSPISAKNTASTTSATRRKQARKDSR